MLFYVDTASDPESKPEFSHCMYSHGLEPQGQLVLKLMLIVIY